jgi:hypothetical protein
VEAALVRVTKASKRKLCEYCEIQIEPGEPQVILSDLQGRLTAMHPKCRIRHLAEVRSPREAPTAA